MSEISALDGRLTHLETALSQSLARIEGLIRQEIQDLKNEQISDIKKTQDRLADDQQRLWDATRDLEKRENLRAGGVKSWGSVGTLLAGIVGGVIAAAATWLSSRGHP